MRAVSETVKSALSSDNLPMLVLVELDFASGFVRVTNAAYSFRWDRRGSLIADTDTLASHQFQTVGAAGEITDLGSTISGGVGRVYFTRTGTTGSDRRIRTSDGAYSITLDKTQDSVISVEIKPVQGVCELTAIGPAVNDQPNTQRRLGTISSAGTVTGLNDCTVISKETLPDGYVSFSLRVPAAFWTGSGATCYLAIFTSWNSPGTWDYYYRKPVLTQAGEEWIGLGNLGSIEAVQEGASLQMYGCGLTLTGIPPEYISLALDEDYQGRACTIWLAPLSTDYQILADPAIVFRGRMDTMDIELGETATITVTAESRLADWERPRVRRYNDEDQQSVHPGDRGMEFVQQMVSRELIWGRQ